MRKIYIMLLLFAGALTIRSQDNSLNAFLGRSKNCLKTAVEINWSAAGFGPSLIYETPTKAKWSCRAEWFTYKNTIDYSRYVACLEYGDSSVFLTLFAESNGKIVKEMYFLHDPKISYWSEPREYFVKLGAGERSTSQIPEISGHPVRFMTELEVKVFDSLAVKIFGTFCVHAVALQEEADSLALIGWQEPKKAIRLLKKPSANNWWQTNILFLEKYEADTLRGKISGREPDTSFSYLEDFGTTRVDQWFLDPERDYVLAKYVSRTTIEGEHVFTELICRKDERVYYLSLHESLGLLIRANEFFGETAEGKIMESILGRYDYTKRISPYRWLHLGIPVRLLNDIKTGLLTRVSKL